MAIYHQDIADIELNSGSLHRSFLGHSIGLTDAAANRFGVRVFRDGVAETLSGVTCQGFFRNANGENIALTSYGTIDGNVAYVTLPQACYNVEGMFTLAIKLVGGGVTGTMRIVDGMVDSTNTGSAVAPTGSVPTYQEVLSVYEQMQAAVTNYDAKVAEQDGKISDLKSAFDKATLEIGENTINGLGGNVPLAWEVGGISSTGAEQDNRPELKRTGFLPVYPNNIFTFTALDDAGVIVRAYNSDKSIAFSRSAMSADNKSTAGTITQVLDLAGAAFIRLVANNIGHTAVDATKISVVVSETEIARKVDHSDIRESLLSQHSGLIEIFPTGWISGSHSNGVISETGFTRLFSAVMNVAVGQKLAVYLPEGFVANALQYDTADTYKGNLPAAIRTAGFSEFQPSWPKIRLLLAHSNDSKIAATEAELVQFFRYSQVNEYTTEHFVGKRISILGDSLSTYGGSVSDPDNERYSPSGNPYTYPGNKCRYPQTSLGVVDPHQTYWMRMIDTLGMVLGINESYAGSRVSWQGLEAQRNIFMASQTRIDHLGENGTPDFILINGGTNDADTNLDTPVEIGTVNYESPQNYTDAQIAALPVATFADAYRTMLIRVMKTYPTAVIYCMMPSYRSGNYGIERLDKFCEIIKEICDLFGVHLIDTRINGVSIFETSAYLPDGTHYNATGMGLVAETVIKGMMFE